MKNKKTQQEPTNDKQPINPQKSLLGHCEDQPSLLNFPEKFPIKILGANDSIFSEVVKRIITNHVDQADLLTWQKNQSRQGNYLSITVTIMAQSQQQLDAIYIDLTANPHVKMAL